MINLRWLLQENTTSDVSKFENVIKTKYPQLHEFGIYFDVSINALFFSDLYVKPEFKGQGIGSLVMKDVISFSDKLKTPILLIPDSDEDSQRLINFYKKFGFVINSGKDTIQKFKIPGSVSMYRLPNK